MFSKKANRWYILSLGIKLLRLRKIFPSTIAQIIDDWWLHDNEVPRGFSYLLRVRKEITARCHTHRSLEQCFRIIVARTLNILRWRNVSLVQDGIHLEWRVYPSCECILPTSRSAYYDGRAGADDSVSLSFSLLETVVKFRMRRASAGCSNKK